MQVGSSGLSRLELSINRKSNSAWVGSSSLSWLEVTVTKKTNSGRVNSSGLESARGLNHQKHKFFIESALEAWVSLRFWNTEIFVLYHNRSRLLIHESALTKLLLMHSNFSKHLQFKVPTRASLQKLQRAYQTNSNILTLIFYNFRAFFIRLHKWRIRAFQLEIYKSSYNVGIPFN